MERNIKGTRMPAIQQTSHLSRVVAVVVSYNRRELLRRVLEGIRSQTRAVQDILVVDNGSTDGTREWLAESFPEATVVESAHNGGGAGGFAKGISWAVRESYEFAWLMDDDAIPDSNCLQRLLEPFGFTEDNVAFTCPQVTDDSGSTGPRNYPVLSSNMTDIYRLSEKSWLPVTAATFVGPLINLEIARKTHAPLEDFFIWHDDFEYTSRLARLGSGVSVPRAHIMHLAANPGPDHYNAARNREHVRNLVWWWRELKREDPREHRRLGFRIVMSLRHQSKLAPKKVEYFGVVFLALREAFADLPRRRNYAEIHSEMLETDSIRLGRLATRNA